MLASPDYVLSVGVLPPRPRWCLCGGRGVPLPYGVRVATASAGRVPMWGFAPQHPPFDFTVSLAAE